MKTTSFGCPRHSNSSSSHPSGSRPQRPIDLVRSAHRSRDSLNSYENLLRKRESRLTRISLSIVWLFIFCHVWKLIPTIYELIHSEVRASYY